MKIRNKHDGTTIESQWMKEERHDFFLRIVEDNFLYDEAIYYKENGWEEVTDTNVGHKWHDLRKDPTDVPNNNRWVWACFNFSGRKQYEQVCFTGQNDWWIAYSTRFVTTNPEAWRELPKFEED